MKTDRLRLLLEYLSTESSTIVEFLAKIAEKFPVVETDMQIWYQLLDVSTFKEFPKLEEMNEM